MFFAYKQKSKLEDKNIIKDVINVTRFCNEKRGNGHHYILLMTYLEVNFEQLWTEIVNG